MDAVVAGGGIAGLALALALKHACPFARVAVCDPAFARPEPAGRAHLRAVAVAAGSRDFLETLGVWPALAEAAQPMRDMAITDSRPADAPRPVYLGFSGRGPDGPFAHMVFSDDLARALRAGCEAAAIERMGAEVTGFRAEGGALRWRRAAGRRCGRGSSSPPTAGVLGSAPRQASLPSVGTTGSRRWSRRSRTRYRTRGGRRSTSCPPVRSRSCRCARPMVRRGAFRSSGPRARRKPRGSQRCRRHAFIDALESRIGFEYGALALEDRPSAQPLRLVLPRRLVADRFALVGDAARTIHPLAGQGLNLGLRDAAVLAEVVSARLALGLDPGDDDCSTTMSGRAASTACHGGRYGRAQPVLLQRRLPLRLLRDFGLGLVDRMPGLKRSFIRDAAGLIGARSRGPAPPVTRQAAATTSQVNSAANRTSDRKWPPKAMRSTLVATPKASAPARAGARSAGGRSRAGAAHQKAAEPSPDTNEQLRAQPPSTR